MDEKNVAIIGSGRMGIGIATALLLADRGLGITLVDLKERPSGQERDSLNGARDEIESNLKLLKELLRTISPTIFWFSLPELVN